MKKTRNAKFYFLKEKKPQTKYFIKQQTIDINFKISFVKIFNGK